MVILSSLLGPPLGLMREDRFDVSEYALTPNLIFDALIVDAGNENVYWNSATLKTASTEPKSRVRRRFALLPWPYGWVYKCGGRSPKIPSAWRWAFSASS